MHFCTFIPICLYFIIKYTLPKFSSIKQHLNSKASIYHFNINFNKNLNMLLINLFLFALIITTSISQLCGATEPSTSDDCYTYESDTSYCCYAGLTFNSTFKTLCVLIPKNVTFAVPYFKNMILPGDYDIDVLINCGNRTQSTSEYICGPANPQVLSDCSQFTNENSCCLFRSESKNSSMCLYSSGLQQRNDELFGYTIKCNGERLIFTFLTLFVILITIF
jgi:hypothetical protein